MSVLKTIGIQHLNGSSPAIQLDANANVGIGTATAGVRLDVVDNGNSTNGQLRLSSSGSFGTRMSFVSTSSNGRNWQIGSNFVDGFGEFSIYDSTAAASRLRIDSSGRVTTPFQPVFAAYGGTTQSWSGTGAYQVLQLTGQLVSNATRSAGYSTSTYRFTAPVAGMYMFFGKITQTGTAGGPSLSLFVNGSLVYTEMTINYGVAYQSSSGMWPYYMNAGDYADLRVINYNNVSMTLDLSRCNFVGWLLG